MEIKKEYEQYLTEYYQDLFSGNVNKRYRAMTGAELKKHLSWLTEANLRPLVKSNKLSDVYTMLSKVCVCLMHRGGHLTGPVLKQWESSCRQMRGLYEAPAGKDLKYVNGLSRKDLEQVLKIQGIRHYLLTNPLERVYQLFYILKTIKRGILEFIRQKPEQEYSGTREMKRTFILHVGSTNSGKAYDALERLKECRHGVYLGPLRLLVLKVCDKLSTEGLSCSMATGEETLEVPEAVCQSCTVEVLNDREYFDTVTMDECQMVADPYHGYSWTRAVLGLRVEETHLCMAPKAEDIMVQMTGRYGDRYKVTCHKRDTRLTMEKKPYNLRRDLKKSNTLIVFPKKSVLALAAHPENEGIHYSVTYESPPPVTRREQMHRFLVGETEVVVSTGAIGMGLSLPICEIVFVETRKFDGVNRWTLNSEEIEQTAGRARGYGLYDRGFMAAIDETEVIEDGLSRMPMSIMRAYVGFPEQLPNLPAEIDTLARIWAGMNTPSVYEKMKVDELPVLYMSFEYVHRDDMGGYSRQEIYKLIICSIDIDDKMVIDPRKDYCREYRDMTRLEFPYGPGEDLYELESYCKMLDLYSQFSRKVRFSVQVENLAEERRGTEEETSHILKTECVGYARKCPAYGKELLWDYPFSICERCFERGKIGRGYSHSGRRHAAGDRV